MDGVTGANSDAQLVTDAFKIRGAAATRAHSSKDEAKRKDVPHDTCSICLEAISERAVAVPCNHLTFDFICLVSWLQERTTCPLCKARVTAVQYDWRSPEDYKTYHVPRKDVVQIGGARGRRHAWRPAGRWSQREGTTLENLEDPTLERRRRVYRNRTYALHVGANRISRHRDFTPRCFAASPDLQRRARAFLRRELKVFTFLDAASAHRGGNRHSMIEYIVAVCKTNELKGASGQAEDLLAELVGRDNARLLLHELEAWLRSPYERLEEWDEIVQYADFARVDGKR